MYICFSKAVDCFVLSNIGANERDTFLKVDCFRYY
jgi:hypothetical protein